MSDYHSTAEALLDLLTTPTRLGSRPGLEKIRQLLALFGDPHRGTPIVHVGGTSGKGSTATMTAEILRSAGYRVGLHVKPHLERVEERFVVDGAPIAPDDLVALIRGATVAARIVQPSWYELTVALALRYFRDQKVDVAVVEVGLGGTYDATNVVDPVVAVLTNVGLDHTEVLGDTIEKIVADKVGIAKAGRPMVSGVTQPSAREIVFAGCAAAGAPLWLSEADFVAEPVAVTHRGSRFDYRSRAATLSNVLLAPLGRHQVANAALAIAALEASGLVDPVSRSDVVRDALGKVRIPGRLEIAATDARLVLDGAHNPAKMFAFVQALDEIFPGRPVTAVVAFKRGHDVGSTLRALANRATGLILTSFEAVTDFGRGQAVTSDELVSLLGAHGIDLPFQVELDPARAVAAALERAPDRGLVAVTGSLYLVGVIRGWLRSGNPAQKLL
ncbi:MAG TPA: folylpolyglutamate synthase/dihydrofolate synthase family protein [Chloroflexota bacterium]|nr:folylpolyglutamate synthase/dihydrofolate synthase family protein [Chloroflexota bacterium]